MRKAKTDLPEVKKKKRERKQHSKIFRLFRRYFIVFTLLAALLFTALCIRSYIGQTTYARSYVALNYARASKGLAPNATRYNMYDFKSAELMNRVIEAAGLQNVTAEELNSCVGISTRGSGSGEYISTGYTLTVNLKPLKNKDIHIDAKSLLHLIADIYTEMFYADSVTQADVLLFDDMDMTGSEYRELSDYYALKLEILSNYVANRAAENSSFVSETTGLSFLDLKEKIGNTQSVDLAKVNAYINTTGITLDKASYLAKLSYLNYRDSETFQRYFSSYSVRLSNISYYDILQSAFVMVPTVDQNGEFYMSMTKTGVDEISRAAQQWNEESSTVKAQIEATDQTISNILKSRNLQTDHQTVQTMLENLRTEIDTLTKQTLLTDGDFISYTTSNYITFTDSPLPAIEKIKFVNNAVPTLAFYAALWLLAWWLLSRKEKKVA